MKLDKKITYKLRNAPKEADEVATLLLNEYEATVILTNGPDPNRSKYWENKGALLMKRIKAFLEVYPVPDPRRTDAGSEPKEG